jgi:hypothetical protein
MTDGIALNQFAPAYRRRLAMIAYPESDAKPRRL